MEDPQAYYFQGCCVCQTTPGVHEQLVVQSHTQSPVRLYGPLSPIAFLCYSCGGYPCRDLKLHSGSTAFIVLRGALRLTDGMENSVECNAPGALLLTSEDGVLFRRWQSSDAIVIEVVLKEGCTVPPATTPTIFTLKRGTITRGEEVQACAACFDIAPTLVSVDVWDGLDLNPLTLPHKMVDTETNEFLVVIDGECLVHVGDCRDIVSGGGQCARIVAPNSHLSPPLVVQPRGNCSSTGFRISLGRCGDAGRPQMHKGALKEQYQQGKCFKPIASITM